MDLHPSTCTIFGKKGILHKHFGRVVQFLPDYTAQVPRIHSGRREMSAPTRLPNVRNTSSRENETRVTTVRKSLRCLHFLTYLMLGHEDPEHNAALLAASFLLTYCLDYSSTLKIEAACFSETSVHFQRATLRRYIPEENSLLL
jgi:hypothetical protein